MKVEAVDEEWLAEIEDEVMGFTNKMPREMLEHLESRGGKMDFIDTNEIKQERDAPWDTNEHVVTYFNRVTQAVKQLERAKIRTDEIELLNQALYTFKQSGELEQALVNWDAKDEAGQTWKKAKEHFTKEFSDRRKYQAVEDKHAGFGSANAVREQAKQEQMADEYTALTRRS